MSGSAVSVKGLGKRYQISHERERYGRLTESLASALRSPVDRLRGRRPATSEWFWALKDVSFEVGHGEVVGVIGRNGAGKSTLLKILSRITEPTTGSARLHGRVGSLLEVGTGFHPELTGRENVYLSAAILGMRRAEIDRKFDEIVDFAGIEQFLDTPVKRYSSGMQVRLGFAVAAHLEPEILVIDEVLAVGDAEFQRKCLGKMGDVARAGRTVLFVSHNMSAVAVLCDRAILLGHGSVVLEAPVERVVRAYADQFAEATAGAGEFVFPDSPEKLVQIERVRLRDDQGSTAGRHELTRPIDVVIDYVVRKDVPAMIAGCEVRANTGEFVFMTLDTDWYNHTGSEAQAQLPSQVGRYEATIHMPAPLLNSGTYELVIYLARGGEYLDRQRDVVLEVVDSGSFASLMGARSGITVIPVRWDVRRRSTPEPQSAAGKGVADSIHL
jgi:lipopolysaccharide transport system ATP-binding protein